MSIAMNEPKTPAPVAPADPFPYPPTDLLEEDGVPLESDWHRIEMNLLIELVFQRMKGRDDYYVGGNMFIYFNAQQARNLDYRGPDFFFVREARLNPPRRYWAIWDEDGKYPDVIVELSSPTTQDADHVIKKSIYEKTFHTHEYFIFDPADNRLYGWRLENHVYRPIKPNERGWLWCEELGLWLGVWHGKFQGKENTYLRFFDEQGNMVPTSSELADMETQRAEAESQRAEAESQRAEAESQRAEAERRRAEAAEAELAQLRKQLAKE